MGTDDLGNLLTLLEQHEGGHGANPELLRHVLDFVDVDFVEFHLWIELAPLLDLGRDGFAWAAPLGEAVEDDCVF